MRIAAGVPIACGERRQVVVDMQLEGWGGFALSVVSCPRFCIERGLEWVGMKRRMKGL